MSLSALSTNRNYNNCCDDIRPFITFVETADTVASAVSAAATGTIDLEDIEELTVQSLIANEITANSITTFEFTTTFISNFTVQSGDDVVFQGTSSANQMFWDSSRNTLYLENAFLKTSECFIYLNNSSDENPLTNSDADKDNGVLFKWFDNNAGIGATEEKLGYFGFKDDTERFTFIPNVSVNNTTCTVSAITEDLGDFEMKDLYVRNMINEDVSQDMGITSVSDINVEGTNINLTSSADTTINSTAGDINISTDGGDLNLDITGDYNISVNNGVLDILVDGSVSDDITIENTFGTVDIISSSTSSQAIYLNSKSGGILLDNDSLSEDIVVRSSNSIQLATTGTVVAQVDETDGLTVNKEKTDYLQWIPYYKFDAFSGIWISNRATPSNPLHFWEKDAAAETTRIYADFEVSSRTTTDKGFQLTSIFLAYNITTESITSITPTITLKEFNPAIPGAIPTLTNIAFTDVNLAAGTAIGNHYRSVDITTPFFLTSEGVINIEIELVTTASSVFHFYGSHLKFDRNHL